MFEQVTSGQVTLVCIGVIITFIATLLMDLHETFTEDLV